MSQPGPLVQPVYPQWDPPIQAVRKAKQRAYPQWDPPTPVIRRPKQKRFGFLALGVSALTALPLGIGIGVGIGLAGDDSTRLAAPAPTVTVTEIAAPPVQRSGAAKGAYTPKTEDFQIGIQIQEKQCFGSAGCTISFRILLYYVGSQSPPAKGVTEVTYLVTGGVRSITNTVEFRSDGTVTFNDSTVDTSSSSPTLTAKITKATYNKSG